MTGTGHQRGEGGRDRPLGGKHARPSWTACVRDSLVSLRLVVVEMSRLIRSLVVLALLLQVFVHVIGLTQL